MFCEKCGAENPDDAKFCSGCGMRIQKGIVKSNGKDMFLALLISFILIGLGIAYAGNRKKGIVLFVVGFVFSILGIGISICSVIGILIWVYGLYETYNQVKIVNGEPNPNLIEDIKGFPTNKKIGAIVVMAIIFLIVVGAAVGALMPKHTTSTNDANLNDDYDSNINLSDSSSSSSSGSSSSSDSGSSSSSGSASSGSSSSSSSSDGYDTHSHYEDEHGSADLEGTVHDDGSVDAHQTGHTDYGDYEINSHMDSDGNIHGTVDVGGKTYYVES